MSFPSAICPERIGADRVAQQDVAGDSCSGDLNACGSVIADHVSGIRDVSADRVAAAANDHADRVAKVGVGGVRADEVSEHDVACGLASRNL